jgi:hypothetical protein
MKEMPQEALSHLAGTADAELRGRIFRYAMENTHPELNP